MTAVASHVDARISGEIRGQVAVGNHIIQNNVDHGGVVYNLAPGETPRSWRRPAPDRRPRRPPALLGRERELAEILAEVADGTPVEIVGPGGIGKTSVLKQVVVQAPAAAGTDGVVYHEARDEPTEDTLQYLFETFYETNVPYKPSTAQVQQALKDIRALVALDDVPPDREGVARVLDTLPSANVVMATARRTLWGSGASVVLRGLPRAAAVALFERELGRTLDPAEHDAALAVAEALEGQPLRLLQVAALVNDLGYELGQLAEELREGSAERLAQLLHQTLDEDQRKVLDLLSSLGGATLPAPQLAAITGVADAGRVIESLMNLGLVQAHSPRYSVTAPGDAGAPAAAGAWSARARAHLISWLEDHRDEPTVVLEESAAVLTTVRLAAREQAWGDLLRLARASEGSFLVGRRWGAWREILENQLTAARRLGDRATEAWALHQLGSRALCLEDVSEARVQLTEALRIREALGDEGGAAVTRHNLGLLNGGKPPAYRPPLGGGWPLLGLPFALLLGVVTVVGGIVGGTLVWINRPPAVFVEPAAASLSVEPSSLDFGTQPVGTTSAPRTIAISNHQAAQTRIERVEITGGGAGAYQLDDGCTGSMLKQEASCTVSVVFAPVTAGPFPAAAAVRQAGRNAVPVALTGTGAAGSVPGLRVDPPSVDFGSQLVGTASAAHRVTLTNTGTSGLDLGPPALAGSEFSLRSHCDLRLPVGQTCSVDVTFSPTGVGRHVGALVITTRRGEARVGLTGVGQPTTPKPPPVLIRLDMPGAITVPYGSQVGPVTVRSSPGAGTTLRATGLPEGFTFRADGRGSGVIAGVARGVPGTVPVTLTAGNGDATTTATLPVTITPADLSIRWASSLLDVSPGGATANATVSLPPGNQGDLTKALVTFRATNVLSGVVTPIGVSQADSSGKVVLTVPPGTLPLGAYTVRPDLDPTVPYFRLVSSKPAAVLVNSDTLSATLYALSDLINLLKP